MKGPDRFLLAMVAGTIILVFVALALVANRPEPTFQPDDTPAGVVHNYLLALDQSEYDRAYGYLAHSLPGYPADVFDFTLDIQSRNDIFYDSQKVTTSVVETNITGQRALVTVKETVTSQGGLFGQSQYSDTFVFTLKREAEAWRISGTDGYNYWVWCWEITKGC